MARRVRGVSNAATTGSVELRTPETRTEAMVWAALRNRQLGGFKFRRQHAVGRYVLDFYCPAAKLAIELDGPIHDSQIEQDEFRTKYLEAYGYRVIRFRNDEVINDLSSVLSRILAACELSPTETNPEVRPFLVESVTDVRPSPRIGRGGSGGG